MLNPVHKLRLAVGFLALMIGWSQQKPVENGSFEGYPSVDVSTAKLQFTIMKQGSTLASVTLADDPDRRQRRDPNCRNYPSQLNERAVN